MTRLFALLAWNPAAGMALDPVAILGARTTAAGTQTAVSWVPDTHDSAWPWRQRLATTPAIDPQVLEQWSEGGAAMDLAELTASEAPLALAVENALDQLLVGLSQGEAQ